MKHDDGSNKARMDEKARHILTAIFPSDNDPNDKRFVQRMTLIAMTAASAIIALVLISTFLGNTDIAITEGGGAGQPAIWGRTGITLGAAVFLTLGWSFYAYLKGRDRNKL